MGKSVSERLVDENPMKASLFAAVSIGIMVTGAAFGESAIPQLVDKPPQVNGTKLIKSAVRDLVNALGDPSNEVRAQAADAVRPIIAANPSTAPHWHSKVHWTQRIEKTKSDMLLDDALALLLPDLSVEERKKASEARSWDGTGVGVYRLDDYWQVLIQLKDWDRPRLNGVPKLESSVRSVWVKPPDKFSGLWVTWHVNGHKAYENEYLNGKRNGTLTAFYDNGSKAYVQHSKDDVSDGNVMGWFKSGKKMYEGQYQNGKQNGIWRHWYENGQMSSESLFKGGQIEQSTTWFENGQKQYEQHYRNGKREGLGAMGRKRQCALSAFVPQ